MINKWWRKSHKRKISIDPCVLGKYSNGTLIDAGLMRYFKREDPELYEAYKLNLERYDKEMEPSRIELEQKDREKELRFTKEYKEKPCKKHAK